ncbi:MAG: hypothetical protein CBD47_09300, partial [Synechococcus sp. TMED187]
MAGALNHRWTDLAARGGARGGIGPHTLAVAAMGRLPTSTTAAANMAAALLTATPARLPATTVWVAPGRLRPALLALLGACTVVLALLRLPAANLGEPGGFARLLQQPGAVADELIDRSVHLAHRRAALVYDRLDGIARQASHLRDLVGVK